MVIHRISQLAPFGTFFAPAALCVAGFFILTGCASQRAEVQPLGEAISISPSGFKAVHYQVNQGGSLWGTVRIWSEGIRPEGLSDVEVKKMNKNVTRMDADWKSPSVHIGLLVSNDSKEILTLDLARSQLELLVEGKDPMRVNESSMPAEGVHVSAGLKKTIHLHFPLPSGFVDDALEGYDFLWTLRRKNQRFTQVTSFARSLVPAHRSAYDPHDVSFHGYPINLND